MSKHAAWVMSAAVAVVTLAACSPPPASPPEGVISVADDDAAMTAAIAAASQTLPLFWREFDRAPVLASINPDKYGLKLALRTPDGSIENIWTGAVERRGDQVFAKIANEPENLPDLQFGSEVEVDPSTIVDWSIQSDEGMYGHYTTRALLAHMSPEEVAQISAVLAPQPTPPSWASAPPPAPTE